MKSTDVLDPIALGKIISASNANEIPVNATGSEFASQEEGFPEITMLPIGDGGEAPHGKDVNGLFRLVMSHLYNIQNGIMETFNPTVANLINGYPKGAMLWLQTENTTQLLQSSKDDNKDNFLTNSSFIGTSWIVTFPTVDAINNALALKANKTDTVNLTGNQTISDIKTFNDAIIRREAFSGASPYTIRAIDSNGKGQTAIIPYYTGSYIYQRIMAENSTAGKNFFLDVIVGDDGTARLSVGGSATTKSANFNNLNNFTVPTPAEGDNSQKAVNTEWANNTLNSKFQVVNELPSSPDESVFYYIAE